MGAAEETEDAKEMLEATADNTTTGWATTGSTP
jgi:hypothetical protein